MINEFVDVFLDEVPRLPPTIEVEFMIYLVLGTTPISRAANRMEPLELRDIKTQL